jgi:NAD(P)-dependent dehydrogenase (short-subunit alcohol dehydrogenase family)
VTAQGTALVTGSTKGIGKAIAERLLREGYKVALNYSTDERRASATLAEFKQISSHVYLIKADIGNPDEAGTLVTRTIDEYGSLDVLVNNAARVADGPALEMTLDAWDRVLDVNLRGAFLCSQAAGHQMLTQDSGGTILNIGASTGLRARRNGVNTCASKAGLMIMTQCFALELAPKVRVNSLIPGTIVTDETVARFGLDNPDVRREREKRIPLRRLGQPEDVANAVMLMLSDNSRFITGQKIVVDGGQNMW